MAETAVRAAFAGLILQGRLANVAAIAARPQAREQNRNGR